MFFAKIKEPEEKNDCDRDAEDEAFEGAAVGEDDDAEAEKKSVTGRLLARMMMPKPRRRASRVR